MNLSGDEKRIQQLFREMSRDDQRRAPAFASVLAAATSGMSRSQDRARALRFAMAMVMMICLATLIAIVVSLKASRLQGPAADDRQASVPPDKPEAPPSVVISPPGLAAKAIAPRRVIIKRAHHRRSSDSLAMAMRSLSSWQSPTASLLQTPSDDLLRSLPRLGESLRTIKPFSPDQFN